MNCRKPQTKDKRILSQIDEKHEEEALRVLQWLCFSMRPMLLDEVVEALAVNLNGDSGFMPEQRFPHLNDIRMICSTLINITASFNKHKKLKLKLAHYSVKEYLISDRIKNTSVQRYHITPVPVSLFMTKTCLLYLLYFNR